MSKDRYAFQIHRVPRGTTLSSRNMKDSLVLQGTPGTRLQASREGVSAASAMASARPIGERPSEWVHPALSRSELEGLVNSLAKYEADGFMFGSPDGFQYHVALEIQD